jgi:hypothetical protein
LIATTRRRRRRRRSQTMPQPDPHKLVELEDGTYRDSDSEEQTIRM